MLQVPRLFALLDLLIPGFQRPPTAHDTFPYACMHTKHLAQTWHQINARQMLAVTAARVIRGSRLLSSTGFRSFSCAGDGISKSLNVTLISGIPTGLDPDNSPSLSITSYFFSVRWGTQLQASLLLPGFAHTPLCQK